MTESRYKSLKRIISILFGLTLEVALIITLYQLLKAY